MNQKDYNAIKLAFILIIVLIGLLYHEIADADVKTGRPEYKLCPDYIKPVPVEREYAVPAAKYGLCPQLFKALLGVESNWNHEAVNATTLDFGIGQINYKTAEALNISISRLKADRAYSIEKAAYVMAYHKRLFKRRLGPNNWICAYNLGYRAHPNHAICKRYIASIKSFNY